jgi:hypothetical protein
VKTVRKGENVYTSDKCRTPKIKGMLICSDEILPLITVNKREKALNIKFNPPKNINSSSADRTTKMNLMEALKHA